MKIISARRMNVSRSVSLVIPAVLEAFNSFVFRGRRGTSSERDRCGNNC